MGRLPVKGPVVIPNTYEFKVEWGDPGAAGVIRFSNVFHVVWGVKPPIDAALANTLMTGITNGMTSSNWATFVHPTTALKRVQVKDISAANLPWFISNVAELAGSGLGDPLAEQVSVVVTSLTAKAGREWHGRTYLGGLDAAAQADARHHSQPAGVAATAFLTAIQGVANQGGTQLGVGQRALQAGQTASGAPLPARSAHTEPITTFAIRSTRLDTQRRRLGR
jgi:hypothetical protein